MEKIWNYFFYCTWEFQKFFSQYFIEKPVVYLFKFIPYLQNNWDKGKSDYNRIFHNKNYGIGVGFAFSLMFSKAMIIYASICLFAVKILDVTVGDTFRYYFVSVLILSFFTNQFLLYRKSKYKKYFKEFEKIEKKSRIYYSAFLFHLGIWCFGLVSVCLTIGFKFK